MEEKNLPHRDAPHLLMEWPIRPNRWTIVGLVMLVVGLLVPVGVWAATNYPDGQAPRGSEAESRVAEVFGQPASSDDTVVGDLLIERFYAVDVETGQRMIADVAKGRIRQLQAWSRDTHGGTGYMVALERNSLQVDKQVLTSFVREMAPPDPDVPYLGLTVLPGGRDGMQLNYDGTIPLEHMPFKAPRGYALFDWLTQVRYTDAQGPYFYSNRGYNFLLNNTESWPYFRTMTGVNKAIFISELIVVDMTSRENKQTYYRLIGNTDGS